MHRHEAKQGTRSAGRPRLVSRHLHFHPSQRIIRLQPPAFIQFPSLLLLGLFSFSPCTAPACSQISDSLFFSPLLYHPYIGLLLVPTPHHSPRPIPADPVLRILRIYISLFLDELRRKYKLPPLQPPSAIFMPSSPPLRSL